MPFLPETVESVLAQTYTDFEVLAIDDGSTDDTPRYLRSLTDPRVVYHRLEKVGLVGALNHGLAVARGHLIARLDGDDVCAPRRLEAQVEYLGRHPECVLLGCDFDEIDAAGRVIGVNSFNVTGDSALRWLLHFSTPFLHPGVVYPTEVCRRLGGYSAGHDVTEDYDLWCRISRVGTMASLAANLMRKRIHPAAISVARRERGLSQSSEIAARYTAGVTPDLTPEVAADLYWLYNLGVLKAAPIASVAAGYRVLRATYQGAAAFDPELAAAIRFVGVRIGYRCLQTARGCWKSPLECVRWINAAGVFDPRHRNPLGPLIRKLTRSRVPFDSLSDQIVKNSI